MAALTITVADIRLTPNTVVDRVTAGETVTPMQPAYKASGGEFYKSANTSALLADCVGLFLTHGEDGIEVEIVRKGLVQVGSGILTINTAYCVGAAGLIIPYGDLASGNFGTFLGWATTTSLLDLQIQASGVATP